MHRQKFRFFLEILSKTYSPCVCKIKCVKIDEKQSIGGRFLSSSWPDPRLSSPMKIPGDAAGRDGVLNKFLQCSKFCEIAVKIICIDPDICRENVEVRYFYNILFQLHLRGADPSRMSCGVW